MKRTKAMYVSLQLCLLVVPVSNIFGQLKGPSSAMFSIVADEADFVATSRNALCRAPLLRGLFSRKNW